MEWLITEQCAWFIFGGIIGYTFMFVIALVSIRKLESHYKTEIYALRLSLKNEEARCWENKQVIDLLKKNYEKEAELRQIMADKIYEKEAYQIIANEFEEKE